MAERANTGKRGRGRPRLDPDDPQPAEIRVRLPHALAERLAQHVERQRRAAWVREQIERGLDEEERPTTPARR